MSFERIFKRCKYMHVAGTIITSLLTNNDNLYQLPLFIAWLRFSRILQFTCLKSGSFMRVKMPCKEHDNPQYAWENITFFSIKMVISISIFILWLILKALVSIKELEENQENSSSTVMVAICLCIVLWHKYNRFIFLLLIQYAFLYCFSQQSYC